MLVKTLIRICALAGAATVINLGDVAAESARFVFGGQERTYVIERPPGQTPRPTIIALHGLNGTGASMARMTGLDRLAPQNGLVALFPERIPQLQGWNFFPRGKEPALLIERTRAVGGPPDDVGFLKGLIGDLVRHGISDPNRIYVVGASNGSFMALRMMCAEAGMLAAAGLVVAGMPDVVGDECRPAKPIPVMLLNGTADTVVPYAGGPVQPGALFSAWSTDRLVSFLRRLNGCAEKQERSQLPNTGGNTIEALRWTGCTGGPVVLYRMIGGDHAAPWTGNVNVAALLVDFFHGKAR
jgi:polyhydroxybutyrate depolymerase